MVCRLVSSRDDCVTHGGCGDGDLVSAQFFDEHLPSEEQIRLIVNWTEFPRRCACRGPYLCAHHQVNYDQQFLAALKLRWED